MKIWEEKNAGSKKDLFGGFFILIALYKVTKVFFLFFSPGSARLRVEACSLLCPVTRNS